MKIQLTGAAAVLAAFAAGRQAVSDANAAISQTSAEGNSVNGQAQQLASTAQRYESGKGC